MAEGAAQAELPAHSAAGSIRQARRGAPPPPRPSPGAAWRQAPASQGQRPPRWKPIARASDNAEEPPRDATAPWQSPGSQALSSADSRTPPPSLTPPRARPAPSPSPDDGIDKRLRAVEAALQAGGRFLDQATERRLRAVEDALQALERRLDPPTAVAAAAEPGSPRSPTAPDDSKPTDRVTNDASTKGTSLRHAVTPYVLDCGDMYTANESVWDSMIFFGHSSIGATNSLMLGGIWALNLTLQTMFIVIVLELMMSDAVLDAEVLDGLLKFRLGLAHSAEWADTVTKRSLAQQMCSFDTKMHLAGVQMSLYHDLDAYVSGGEIAQCLVVFIQILWLCTIMRDFENTINIFRAVRRVKVGSVTRMVITDMDHDGAEDAPVPPVPPVLSLMKSRTESVPEDEHLSDFMKVVRLVTLHRGRVIFVAVFVCLPKLLVAGTLWWFGAKWLANTINFSDLILNGVALAFVLEFDEVLYSVLMPRRTKTLIVNLEPLPIRPRSPGSSLSGVATALLLVFVTATITLLYIYIILPINWQVTQGNAIVCSGDLNFIYTVNPATTMVHIAKTTGANVYTDTEEIIAQVTQVELMENDGWSDLISQSLFDTSRSTFARAVNELEDFDHIVSMTYWSLAEAASVLPCRDLGSGESTEASLQQLRVLTGNSAITSCDDIPSYLCSVRENFWLRAICPRRCRCEEPLLNNVGFFTDRSFGCPSQCDTFKAAMNEISFRFGLSTVEWDTDRRLQGSNETQNASHSNTTQGPQASNSTAGTDEVELPSVFQGCADLDSTEFSFAGGCADSNGETNLDMNGHDCTIYVIAPALCGLRDDEDFQAAEMCCACGGGRNDVLSSTSCWDSFVDDCWYMPPKPRAFLLYARGLFDYLLSLSGFRDSVTEVVGKDYAGIAPDEAQMAELVDHVSTGALGRALVSGIWELSPGLAHPRGLTGCAFLASYEVTSLLNLDLCSDGVHAPLRWFCPEACGCDPSYSMSQCPVACILPECLTEFAGCAHVHPWFSDECLAGYDNAGGQPTCKKCTGGATRRRRATSCTDCPEGFFDDENVDDCERCLEGATRRRRSESCTDCGPGSYDAGDSDECTPCPGGATTRRRSTSCVECAAGSYSEGGVEDDCQPCMGVSTSRRRAANVSECPPSYYNDGSSDDCSQCGGLGGETRRRRAESCTACQKYASSEGEDGCSPVDCPSDATGESVSAGCWCGTGFSGSIRATTESPYYSGECVELPFYIRTSGFCPVPILNADLCAKAAQVVGLRATYDEDFVTDRAESWVVVDDDYIPGDYSSEPSGCYETPDDGSELFINAVGENACSSSYRCICLGYENEFACTDLSGSIGGAACPDTGNISFQATTDCDDVDRWSCCGCGGGELEKPNNNGCVDTDGLSLRAPITEGTPGQAESFEVEDRDATPSPSTVSCLQWDWAPHTCQWASYYDSEDFTATDMCCSCGGGTYETETHSETTRTTTETTTEATNGTTNWTITETTTETTTNANVTIGGPL